MLIKSALVFRLLKYDFMKMVGNMSTAGAKSEVVSYSRQGDIGVITVNCPPVNALGHAVRSGLLAAIEQGQADAEAKVLLLVCEGRTFMAGADIREFGKPMQAPGLPQVIDAY